MFKLRRQKSPEELEAERRGYEKEQSVIEGQRIKKAEARGRDRAHGGAPVRVARGLGKALTGKTARKVGKGTLKLGAQILLNPAPKRKAAKKRAKPKPRRRYI